MKLNEMMETRKKTILIVDDIQENIDVLRGILCNNYIVKVATSGRLALKVATSARLPDLILLDVMMPEIDGYEICRQLKSNERTWNIPVIFVTARSGVDDEAHGFSLGAADYIVKPISPPLVLARVRTHLALYDRSRHLEGMVSERTASLLAKSHELESTRMEIIRCLGRAAEYRDNETGFHIVRMAHYVKLLALKSGLPDSEAELMMTAAIMHDIGKIGIPDHILLKPGKLTEEEFELIKQHPRIGADIIGKHDSRLLQMSRDVALTHHEQWNGKGYPNGLKGEEIPLVGRMTAIADIFDALTSGRPYKKAWNIDAAMALLEQKSGEALDPELTTLFIELRQDVQKIMDKFRDTDEPIASI